MSGSGGPFHRKTLNPYLRNDHIPFDVRGPALAAFPRHLRKGSSHACNAYRASHAIFVREGATQAFDRVDDVPAVFRTRMLSLRAYDANDLMVDADLVDGTQVEYLVGRMLSRADVAYIHAHYAKRGCYAARIDRA